MKYHIWFGMYILDNFYGNIVKLLYFFWQKITLATENLLLVWNRNLLGKEESAFRKKFKNYCYVLKNSRSQI